MDQAQHVPSGWPLVSWSQPRRQSNGALNIGYHMLSFTTVHDEQESK